MEAATRRQSKALPRGRTCESLLRGVQWPEAKGKKLVLMRKLAKVRFGSLRGDELKARRRAFEKSRPPLEGKRCFVCNRAAECIHHLIQLKNGGTDEAINLVPLCNRHHEAIHPWMKDKKAHDKQAILTKKRAKSFKAICKRFERLHKDDKRKFLEWVGTTYGTVVIKP